MNNEEAIKVLSESIHYGSKVPWDKIVEAVHLSIEALSQPSLPSDLDEAAHEFEDKAMSDYDYISVTENGIKRPVLKYSFTDAFRAGAEWMAGQGVTREFEVYLESLRTPDGTLYEYPACYMKLPGGVAGTYDVPENEYKEGDKVVVQIRKK